MMFLANTTRTEMDTWTVRRFSQCLKTRSRTCTKPKRWSSVMWKSSWVKSTTTTTAAKKWPHQRRQRCNSEQLDWRDPKNGEIKIQESERSLEFLWRYFWTKKPSFEDFVLCSFQRPITNCYLGLLWQKPYPRDFHSLPVPNYDHSSMLDLA